MSETTDLHNSVYCISSWVSSYDNIMLDGSHDQSRQKTILTLSTRMPLLRRRNAYYFCNVRVESFNIVQDPIETLAALYIS